MGLNEFREKITAEPAFAELVKALKSFEEIAAFGKEHGFDFMLEDLQGAQLTDEELEAVAGGKELTEVQKNYLDYYNPPVR